VPTTIFIQFEDEHLDSFLNDDVRKLLDKPHRRVIRSLPLTASKVAHVRAEVGPHIVVG
jgi:hypothetical protein